MQTSCLFIGSSIDSYQPHLMDEIRIIPELIVVLDKSLDVLVLLLHGHELPLLELEQLGVQLLHRLVREELLLGDAARARRKRALLLLVLLQLSVQMLQLHFGAL